MLQVRAPPQGINKLKKLLEERVQAQPRKFERVMRRRDKNRDGCVGGVVCCVMDLTLHHRFLVVERMRLYYLDVDIDMDC